MYANRRTRGQTGGAQGEPVSLAELKDHCRVDYDTDDELLSALIVDATDHVEQVTGLSLVSKTVDYYADAFPYGDNPIVLPFPPLVSVTSVTYYDSADTLQTWDSAEYTVDTNPQYYGLIYPARQSSYPSARIYPSSVIVEYVAGYTDSGSGDPADNVPESLKLAVKLLAAHFYENREATIMDSFSLSAMPLGFQSLIANYRVMRF